MTSFNDRRESEGPKNLLDLARKAQVYKDLLKARKSASDARTAYYDAVTADHPATELLRAHAEGQQEILNDTFSEFADLHRHPETGEVDAGSMQASIDYFNSFLRKGKGF